jgi:hypothetical protein
VTLWIVDIVGLLHIAGNISAEAWGIRHQAICVLYL